MTTNAAPGFVQHPRHRVDIQRSAAKVEVEFARRVIASTHNALCVDESRHDLVFYVPRSDVCMDLLTATLHTSYCPFKGIARYWSIGVDDRCAENAVWAYDEPYDEALPWRGHVSFYSDRVDRIVTDGKADR